jgi:signal transduction histidine kinase
MQMETQQRITYRRSMQNAIDPIPSDGSDGGNTGPERLGVSDAGTGPKTRVALMAEEAHKVREHLTVILGSLEQLQHQSLDDRGRRQLQRARIAAEQLATIVGSFAGG